VSVERNPEYDFLMTLSTTSDELTSETFKPLLKKLVNNPSEFTASDTTLAFRHLLSLAAPKSNESSQSPSASLVTPAQIGAFLASLHLHGLEKRPEILAAAARVLRDHCIRPVVEGYDDGAVVVDIVGTGGDGHDTFNVSTSAAIIAAGAGLRVCKVRSHTDSTNRFKFSSETSTK
jgi:anthranilate phosphoribosyltransferase